ncbi:MAG: phosphoethanolamine--lipid A transferase [Campylobacteraceae bacterium]|jgi:lipid A ethanolaminephosphotransferase|nr:phosphoethanolamine--lipid A transferase [Campylobacteraceae bacterium]
MLTGFSKFIKKLNIKSAHLIILLTLYFGIILNLSLWRFVLNHIELNFSGILFLSSFILLVLSLLYIVFNIIVLPYIAKPLITILLLISGGTNFLMFRFGAYIDVDMLRNTFETTAREASDFFTIPFVLVFALTGVLPALLLIFSNIKYDSLQKEIKRRSIFSIAFLLLSVILSLFVYKDYASFMRNNREFRKLVNPSNYIYATFRYIESIYKVEKQLVHIDEEAVHTPYKDDLVTVIIFIVGETARAKNFSLYGYEKETNPLLVKQDIIAFKEVGACGTSTAVSVPCMFSDKTRKDFNVGEAKYTENLIDLAKQSGYDIIWLENDDGCKGVCERVYTENMKETGNQKYCDDRYCKDEVLIYDLEDRLKKIKKDTFLILHTMGSHGPSYYRRYPDEFKKFTPTCDTADIQKCSQEEIVNTYDNTIAYTDYIISSTIDTLSKFPFESGVMYVSDHGESLGENNLYLHSLPYTIAPKEQLQVPMILWMSENMKMWDYIDYDCVKKEAETKVYSHDNIFHSIIGLLEIKSKLYDKNYDIFSSCRTKELIGYTE